MLTLSFHHKEPVSVDKLSEASVHEVMRTINLEDLKHVKVLHKSTRELDVFFENEYKAILVLNLLGSLYRTETEISSTGAIEDMITEFTKFTYKFKAHYPFKLTKAKTAELARMVIEDDRNQRSFTVDDYSYDNDYSSSDSDDFSFPELTKETRSPKPTRPALRNTSPFNQRRQRNKKQESPFGSIGKVISFFIKAIIILSLIRTCASRFGENSSPENSPMYYTTHAEVISVTDLPTYMARGKSADGTSRADWKMMHYSYSHKNNIYRNQRIMSSKELELLGTQMPSVGDYINVEINSDFPSLSTVKTIVLIPSKKTNSEITYEFLSTELDEEVIE